MSADQQAFDDHKKFIGTCALVSASALITLPLGFAAIAPFQNMEMVLAFGFAVPLLAGFFVSATGRLEQGARFLIGATLAFISALAIMIGGLSAGVLLALIAVCLEAAFWGGRKQAVWAALLATGSVFLVAIVAGRGSLSEFALSPTAFFLVIAYAATLAYRLAEFQTTYKTENTSLKRRFRLLAENSSELVTKHDVNGATLFASPVASTMLGTASVTLLNTGLLEKIHLQDRVVFLQHISNAAKSKEDVTCTLRIRCKGLSDLAWKHVEMRARALPVSAGTQPEIVAVFRDVTNQEIQSAKVAEAQANVDDLGEAQRRFLTTISHELRTPLNAIIGFSEIIVEQLFGEMKNDRYLEYAGLIRESGDHLLSVVNDMLDASKIEAGKYELQFSTFEIKDVAEATVNMLGTMASDGKVTVCTDVQADLPTIQADRRACQQILINLLSNAIKFTPEGGNVRISAKPHGRSVKLRVKDTGIGFEKEFQNTVGQPFAQADNGYDRQHNGTGLGLSVVKGLVALHGGTLDIHSEPKLGTSVTVTLPFKARSSVPMPADAQSGLVDLNERKNAPKPATTAKSNLDEGERRASLSA